jgi:hypothetical protein
VLGTLVHHNSVLARLMKKAELGEGDWQAHRYEAKARRTCPPSSRSPASRASRCGTCSTHGREGCAAGRSATRSRRSTSRSSRKAGSQRSCSSLAFAEWGKEALEEDGIPVDGVKPHTDKIVRAEPVSNHYEGKAS